MSIGSCTSCSPVLDAAKLSANPKADLNGDGKVSASELQASKLQTDTKIPDAKTSDTKDLLKTNTDSKTDPYVASKSPSAVSASNFLQLAENKAPPNPTSSAISNYKAADSLS